MIVAILSNNEIETTGHISDLFSNVSFPPSGPEQEWMDENNVIPVTYWKTYDANLEKLIPVDPYLEDGEVFAVEVQELSAEEIEARLTTQWAKVRADRDQRLAKTDWIVTKSLEAGEAVPTVWVEYRQALRDITEQEDPFNIIWPELPSE